MQEEENMVVKHDGNPVPVELWGKDHIITLLYIETRCVDYKGAVAPQHMRSHPTRSHPAALSGGAYPTRLADGSELYDHDDWDCLYDLKAAGLLEWPSKPSLPQNVRMTNKGWAVAHRLRRAGAENDMISLQEIFREVP
jgi:hypothetical protein